MKFFIGLFILSVFVSHCQIIGIDFGANYVAVGLLKSGTATTLVRNENEKRITPSYVTLDGNDRFVGLKSSSRASRLSPYTSTNIIQLLGRSSCPAHSTYIYPSPRCFLTFNFYFVFFFFSID
jgi:molecular chaperone DnaK (HSP70)